VGYVAIADDLRGRSFAIVRAYLRGDLEALDELLVMVTEVLVGALLRLVTPEELERQVTAWLDGRPARLGNQPT
jgi:hypothetical protein